MSKSYNNTIEIFAESNDLKKKVMSIVTDSTPIESPKDSTRCNVAAMYALFASESEQEKLESLYRNPMEDAEHRGGRLFGYGDAKKMLLEKINTTFEPFREKRKQLSAHPEYVEFVLHRGVKRAKIEAQKTMNLVREVLGLRKI